MNKVRIALIFSCFMALEVFAAHYESFPMAHHYGSCSTTGAYVQFRELENSEAGERINEQIRTEMEAQFNDSKGKPGSRWCEPGVLGGDVELYASVDLLDPELIALHYRRHSCGANCGYWQTVMLFDPKSGERLHLTNLLSDDAIAWLRDYVIKDLSQHGSLNPEDEHLLKIIDEALSRTTVTNRHLEVDINDYVFGHVRGPFSVKVPLEQLPVPENHLLKKLRPANIHGVNVRLSLGYTYYRQRNVEPKPLVFNFLNYAMLVLQKYVDEYQVNAQGHLIYAVMGDEKPKVFFSLNEGELSAAMQREVLYDLSQYTGKNYESQPFAGAIQFSNREGWPPLEVHWPEGWPVHERGQASTDERNAFIRGLFEAN